MKCVVDSAARGGGGGILILESSSSEDVGCGEQTAASSERVARPEARAARASSALCPVEMLLAMKWVSSCVFEDEQSETIAGSDMAKSWVHDSLFEGDEVSVIMDGSVRTAGVTAGSANMTRDMLSKLMIDEHWTVLWDRWS